MKHTRDFPSESITNQRIRQFSLFPKAKNIIEETKKFANVSQNETLKTISQHLASTIHNKESLTCLTGTESQAPLLGNYEKFKRHDRINPFTVEEYYFLRNNLPSKPEEVRPPLGNTTRGGLDSLISLGGYGDSKKMRESMR